MAYVEGTGSLPPELDLKFKCNKYGALPLAGGILDQPAGLLDRMETLYAVYRAWRLWVNRQPGHEKEFAEEHPSEWPLILSIMEINGHSSAVPDLGKK